MAAVSLSPTPVPFSSAMSSSMPTRRVPLSVNANAANSPLRAVAGGGTAAAAASSAAALAFAKQRRSHASMQREENYGLAPPAKKQMLDRADNVTVTNARVSGLRSPTSTVTLRRVPHVHRVSTSRVYQPERASSHQQQQQQQQPQPQPQHQQHHSHHHHHQEIQKISEKEAEEVRRWQQSQRQRFPKLVFYFDSLPEDQSARLSKQVSFLGAREDKFFSIDITHVVTTRPIPPEEKPMAKQQQQAALGKEHHAHAPEIIHENVQTINPSLLSRTHVNELGITTTSLPVKRKLFDTASSRRMPLAPFGAAEDAIRKPKATRSTDILQRAREMGKKIWSLEKLQKVLDMLLEPDPYRSAELGQRMRNGSTASGVAVSQQGGSSRFAAGGDQVLLQMLDKERHSGPSDRDPTVATRELIYFKGYYIYVYDIEEKQRPIMVRDYAKVADREEGDWPQLRPSAGTRCPFIEDTDQLELRAEKKRARMRTAAAAAAAASAAGPSAAAAAGSGGAGTSAKASLQKTLASRYAAGTAAAAARASAAPKQVIGKRTLTEMEDGHNRQSALSGTPSLRPADGGAASAGSVSSVASAAPPSKVSRATMAEFQAQNAFTSRAKSARCFAGEPVASGLQAAGITSAIRSQMISSATGTLGGARAGTSKEIHGLQRKVLQKSTSTTSQQDASSRRVADMSMEQRPNYSRSTSLGRSTAAAAQLSAKLNMALDGSAASNDEKHKRTMSAPVAAAAPVPRQKKRDPKPGYCENCQDKFDDFEDHIVSHKHRKFAEDERNWTDLDDLLSQLTRHTKHGFEAW